MKNLKNKPVVAISSTALDLPQHRKEVMSACLQQDMFPKMMEHLPASPADAIDASMALVDSADIYLAIIAFRYGYVPDGHDISITEMEFNRAQERKVPRLIFLMHEDHPLKVSDVERGSGAAKLEALRTRMKKEQVVNYFKSPADLRGLVVNSLSQYRQHTTKADGGLLYDTAIVEMIHPGQSRIGSIMNQIEPFPAFPYFSAESDHPSQWPPRIFKERTAFHQHIVQKLSGPAGRELAAWRKGSPPKISMPGRTEDDPSLNYSSLRMFLTEMGGDFNSVGKVVGPACEQALRELEEARQALEENTPNRLLILRVLNQSEEDITNFRAEISLHGSVYDVTVNSMGEQAKSEEWTPNRFSIGLPLLQPSYKVDLYVWYYYQPIETMVFPGAMDFRWAQTEGIVLENLVASGVRITQSDKLLNDLAAYHRYPVDPVRNSPGFGRIELPEEEEDEEGEVQQSAKVNTSYLKISPPNGIGPFALFLRVAISEYYRQKNDAYEAQLIFANAMDDFYEDLKTTIAGAGGSLVYEFKDPVSIDFSRYSGEYSLRGQLLVIFKAPASVDISKLSGVDIISNISPIYGDYISWDNAKYEVVLHFFTDTRDSAGDSKRVLTNKLPLDEIFDTQADNPNAISPDFARLLKYTRHCLEAYYGKSFTLAQEGKENAPFYIMARNRNVSENVYLPPAWMNIRAVEDFTPDEKTKLFASLSRMYDYGNQSEELSKDEFADLFSSRKS